jgi:hypothetical protein
MVWDEESNRGIVGNGSSCEDWNFVRDAWCVYVPSGPRKPILVFMAENKRKRLMKRRSEESSTEY